jgi:acyl-coenzyme A synthetase/AMP-(fatty) acid ligase
MHPLVTHAELSDTFAYRRGEAVSVSQYLTDVYECLGRLPQASYVLLACQDRYAFAVGFGAALLKGQSCLLPSTHTQELIAKLASTHEGLYCLTDESDCSIQLPQTNLESWLLQTSPASGLAMPMISAEHVAAYVFTSGSTGLPLAHRKTWGRLVVNVKSEGRRLGVVPDSHYTVIGTVPPQHMYGFESTVLIAMQNAASFESGKPFYPADIERVVAGTPRPRALVTTPFHLRALLTAVTNPSVIDLLVCATAPLSVDLAKLAEEKTTARLLEIYGSTETGQLATRRTTQTGDWHTFDGIRIHVSENTSFASGDQIEGVVPINDVLELKNECIFILHGRTADMVNIAGKSTTLAYLNHELLSIHGVEDGVFFVQHQDAEGLGNTARLAVVAVAPTHSNDTLLAELRRKIAPAFLPRPLKLVSKMPRNSTGKLPHEALLRLIQKPLDS